jgi:PAS domain S-box-containing protein
MMLRRKSLIPRPGATSRAPSGGGPPADPGAGEGQYQAIFDRYPHPVWILDRATLRFLAVNETAVERYGYSREEFLSMSYPGIHLSEDEDELRQKLGQYAGSSGASDWRQRTKSGSLVRIHAVWRPVPFNRVPAILMIGESSPPARRRLLEETEEGRDRLLALSRRLVEVQETERSEIARELHDEIGQLLTGLKLLIASGARAGSPDPDQEEMAAIVGELIGRLRDISMSLRPPMLDEIGLLPTLLWHFERYTARTHVRVSLRQTIENARFPAPVEIAAFRIIQEALTNVARYAGVECVEVDVRAGRESLVLRIEDRGRGFNPRTAPSGGSAGIIGMQERAHLVGGHLTLESAMAAGTRIAVVLPVGCHEAEAEVPKP